MYNPTFDVHKKNPIILGIESSCDETAAAVIRGREILSDEIASSASTQALFGGVVPEIASRAHTDAVAEVVSRAIEKAGITAQDIDAVAVTYGAGLLGALLVGVSFAKAFAYALNKPLIAVNHIRGHIAAAYLVEKQLKPPFITLLASGGHTAILYAKTEAEFEILGATLDDAAGEAFDKVARVLGLQYPGGPNVQRCAMDGKPCIPMPKMLKGGGGYNFSYSGLKTAVINYCHTKEQKGEEYSKADVACSFQAAAIDVLVDKALQAAKETGVDTITVGGGVAANDYLRLTLTSACQKAGLKLVLPEKRYCTDNAAMIASEGLVQYRLGELCADELECQGVNPLVGYLEKWGQSMTAALLHAAHETHTFWEFVWENTQHAFLDTLPLLPWLLLIYIVLQLLENKTNLAGSNRLGGRLGPVIGSATGLIPQCGFSVLAAKLYEQKYITVGTLLAIFLSTSDEAFIIMLSSGSADAAISVLSMVAVKIAVGIAVGYAADGILRWIGKGQVRLQAHAIDTVMGAKKPETVRDIFMLRYFEDMGAADGCSCGREHDDSRPFMTYVVGPILHALQITVLMFVFNFLMGALLHFIGEDNFAAFMDRHLYLQPVLVSLVGLIPNCASSVFITSAYLEGTIAFGSCVAGLCANAGLGFVVLLRNTHKWKRNLLLIGVSYGVAVAVGLLCNLMMTLL